MRICALERTDPEVFPCSGLSPLIGEKPWQLATISSVSQASTLSFFGGERELIVRLKSVIDTTGLGRSSIYKYIAEGMFPLPIPLGERAVGWLESEVQDRILACIEERDKGKNAE